MTDGATGSDRDLFVQYGVPVVVFGGAGVLLLSAAGPLSQGRPVETWIVDVTLAVLAVGTYLAVRGLAWIDDASDRRVGRPTVALLFVTWVGVCALLVSRGFTSSRVMAFTAIGLVGLVAVVYAMARGRPDR